MGAFNDFTFSRQGRQDFLADSSKQDWFEELLIEMVLDSV